MTRTADAPALRGATLYFDCATGIAGDMTVGALVDLGVPEDVVRGALARLPLSGYRVTFDRVLRGGLTGTKFRVLIDEAAGHALEHRHAHGPAHAGDPVIEEAHGHEHHEHGHEQHDHGHEHHEHGHEHHEHGHEHEQHGHHGHEHHTHDGDTHDHNTNVVGAHDHAHEHGTGEVHAHVHYGAIRRMIVEAGLGEGVRRRALAMFDRVAEVEAKLHGVPVTDVAFHEVGAVDSIVDIVAAAAALDWLSPGRVVSRRVPLGRGTVRTAHGRLPVPAPATLELLRGAAVEEGGLDGELTTPTGAAVLAAAAESYGALPPMTVLGVGWGAGDKDFPGRPNLLRVIAGQEAAATVETVHVIEANIDDMSPELAAPLVEALLGAGALDAWIAPVVMKKGRPAFVVSALAGEAARAQVEAALLAESTTIGLRRHAVERTVLPRHIVEVETIFGRVPVKVAGEPGKEANAAPEFEACRRIAEERGVPLKRVYAEAIAAFYRR